jgi:hypothetical protein
MRTELNVFFLLHPTNHIPSKIQILQFIWIYQNFCLFGANSSCVASSQILLLLLQLSCNIRANKTLSVHIQSDSHPMCSRWSSICRWVKSVPSTRATHRISIFQDVQTNEIHKVTYRWVHSTKLWLVKRLTYECFQLIIDY